MVYSCSHLRYRLAVKTKTKSHSARRLPTQLRARQTVEAILDAVVRILKREGFEAVTTNRIAKVGGVSIGSVYQYFPDKRAIFSALHERHVEQIDRIVQSALVENASSSLDRLMTSMIEAMIDAHTKDPELHQLLLAEVPHRADGTRDFAVRMHGAFLLAISSRADELAKNRDPDKLAFVVTHMVESLSHGAVFRRPPHLSLTQATSEIMRAVLTFLHA
jgi:AcrR family transcriptional regulator